MKKMGRREKLQVLSLFATYMDARVTATSILNEHHVSEKVAVLACSHGV